MQDEKMIVTADLGTSKIAITVARVRGGEIQVIYHHRTPSDGIRHGNLVNPKLAAEALRKAVEDAENEIDGRISQIYAGLPRYCIRQELRTNCIERSDSGSFISREDIESLKGIAMESIELKDEKSAIYALCAQSYSAEEMFQMLEDDVVGIPSRKLEGNFKVFLGPRKDYDNIDRMANEVNVAVADKFFLAEALGKVVLTPEEMDGGVALVEMGAGVTSVSVFQGGILRYFGSIPFGGKTITGDIKLECGFSESLAENVKIAFGACQSDKLQTLADKVLQISDERSGNSEQLPVKYLSEIVNSREMEIFDAILFLLQQSGYSDSLRQGIVLTGGAAELLNCPGLFKEMSGISVRVGHPRPKGIFTADCRGICELDAGASLAMLTMAAANPINCVNELSPSARAARTAKAVAAAAASKASRPEAAKRQDDDSPINLGGLFEESEMKSDQPERPARTSKPQRPGKGQKSTILTKLGNLFDDALTVMYDSKEEEEDKNKEQ